MTSCLWTGAGAAVSGAGLCLAQLPVVDDAITHAAAVERLGIVGLLSALLICSVGANVWLLRQGVGKLIDLIERAIAMMDRATTAIDQMTATSDAFRRAAERCELAHRH